MKSFAKEKLDKIDLTSCFKIRKQDEQMQKSGGDDGSIDLDNPERDEHFVSMTTA